MAGLNEDCGEACVSPKGAWDGSNDRRGCDGDFVKVGAGGTCSCS
jgi:hypothetical protein